MALVCETVTATTMAELRARRDAVVDADLIELRLDGVADADVTGALHGRRRPVVITCRPEWEGGRFNGSEEERLGLLAEAMRQGAEYVDVEWKADRRRLPPAGASSSAIVLSHHDFSSVPTDLSERVSAMRAESPAIVKVAVMATRLTDCLRLKEALDGHASQQHIAIAMGQAGQVTRVWPAGWNSCWTYAGSAAPGQLSARDLVERYRVRTITSGTAVYGIAGWPLGHSASPAMHNAAFAALKMDAVYLPFETASIGDLLALADAFGVAGLSVTAPLKTAAAAACVDMDELARDVGAVNTLRRSPEGWVGRNFDIAGFLAPLDARALGRAGERAVVIGAGGAARSAARALVARGLSVTVSARRREAAERVAALSGASAGVWPPARGWDLLVNATPVGAWPQVDEVPVEALAGRGSTVYDLVYNPADTRLLREARAAGATTIGGLEMLVEQACRQCAWWTGQTAPREAMASAAEQFLGAK